MKIKFLSQFTFILAIVAFTSTESKAEAISMRGKSIVDTDIADAMCSPRTLSVRRVVEYLAKQPNLEEVTELEFRENDMSMVGVSELLDFVLNKMPALQHLDVSYNKIYESREVDVDVAFRKKLHELLSKQDFEKFSFHVNGIANIGWVRSFNSSLDNSESLKLDWHG
ncbi:MAG: hypothetical protein HON43_07975 [Alphaproteobacteria bacterium]|jgi:hypothetical protein|nr:hypothetical protein [Alphaproteobacteria bacterium]MBT5390703.1 hypothetical protein [Alphaproteobacteria bacterium]